MVLSAQFFAQKALGGRCIAFGREQEVDRRTLGIHVKLASLEQTGNRWDTEHPSILAACLSGRASKVATLPFFQSLIKTRRQLSKKSRLELT
jgi:hypothetical protein